LEVEVEPGVLFNELEISHDSPNNVDEAPRDEKKPFSFIEAVLRKPPPEAALIEQAEKDAAKKVAKPTFTNKCKHGYATADSRQLWLEQRGMTGSEAAKISSSLEASTDPKKPIYFWQLFSVLGPDRIYNIVKKFYENVYADKEDEHFREAFTRISGVEHHIMTQTAFWVDAMGGGRRYHGGWYRLSFHHDYNAHQVMNKDGAVRWMYHMNRALEASDLTEDPRVKASVVDFLQTHMDKYADQFDFDSEGIDYGAKCPVQH